MKVFSGTSNPQLAQKIAHALSVPLGNVEITRFIDNECRVHVDEDVAGEDVFVIQSLSQVADQHLVELCLLGQSLKDLGAKRVTAVIPWMGYSKQDKAFRPGEAISAQLVARFIEVAGFDRVVACELHSEAVVPYFSIPFTEISTHALLANTLNQNDANNIVVVSPDKGGKSRSERFAQEHDFPIVYLDKTRDLQSGDVAVTKIDGDVKNKTVIIFDDIINTGETAIKASRFVKSNGASRVHFLATHAVFAGDAAKLLRNSDIDTVTVTDTIDIAQNKHFDRLAIVSVAPLLARAIGELSR